MASVGYAGPVIATVPLASTAGVPQGMAAIKSLATVFRNTWSTSRTYLGTAEPIYAGTSTYSNGFGAGDMTAPGTFVIPVNQTVYVPFWSPSQLSPFLWAISTQAASSGTVNVVVYAASAANGMPTGPTLGSMMTLAVPNSGKYTPTATSYLNYGWSWIAIGCVTAAVTMYTPIAARSPVAGSAGPTNANPVMYMVDTTTGTPPASAAPATLTAGTAALPPFIGFRMS